MPDLPCPPFGSVRLCGLARLSGLARLCGLVRSLGLRGCSGNPAFWRQPKIQIWISKKRSAPLRRNAYFFWKPISLQAPSDQTYKNTRFFDDPVGLSKKMCAGLRRNAKKYEIEFRKEAPTQTVGAKHQKSQWFFNIFHEKLSDSLPKQNQR